MKSRSGPAVERENVACKCRQRINIDHPANDMKSEASLASLQRRGSKAVNMADGAAQKTKANNKKKPGENIDVVKETRQVTVGKHA